LSSSAERFLGRFSIMERRSAYGAPIPYGLPTGLLPSPNHLRILAAKLRKTCTRDLASAALDAMARAVKAGRED
jgi:hypothetical protein